jgi:curved DNA-binding protein CbpA
LIFVSDCHTKSSRYFTRPRIRLPQQYRLGFSATTFAQKGSIVMDTRRCLEVLELECVSSPKELKDAYRKMVKRWHPDRFHGDSSLVQQAELKLTEINLAYKHLLTYFDPDLSRYLKNACPPPDRKASFKGSGNPSANSHKEPDGRFAGEKYSGLKSSSKFDHIKIHSAPKKSISSRLALCFVFCFFIAFSGVAFYLIHNLDKITFQTSTMASGVLKKVKADLEQELAVEIKKLGVAPISLPPSPADAQKTDDKSRLNRNKEYYEIHLSGGTVIVTPAWWYEGDMVMFKQFGGAMGVEKNRVVKIVASN